MKALRWRISLKAILAALVIGALLPPIAFLFVELSNANREKSEALERDGRDIAGRIALMVERIVAERIALMRGLATSSALREHDFAGFYDQARAVLDPVEGVVVVVDRDQRMILSTAVPFGAELPKTTDTATAQEAFRTGDPQISDVVVSPFTQRRVLSMVYAPKGSEFALRISIRGEWLSQQLLGAVEPEWTVAVVDRAGIVAARSRDPERWIGAPATPSAMARIRTSASGWAETTTLDGLPYYTSWRRLPFGWTVAAGVDRNDLSLAVRGETRRVSIWAGVVVATGLLLAALGGAALARPLTSLSNALAEYGTQGNFVRPGTIVREIDAVGAALNEAIAARRQAEEQAHATEQRMQAIVETAIDAIVVIDQRGTILSANPSTERLFGYAPREILGRNVSVLMPEPHQSGHDGYIGSYLRTGRAGIIGGGREVEGRRSDGSFFPMELSVVEWRLAGKTFFTGVMRDISERKNREEQIKSLLREVNHRSKNLLTVVQAIARRTAASAPADFAEKFSGRLRALAANQDLLVSSEWRGVDIHTMIGAQLAHFPDMMESRISIDGPSLTLQPAAAQAIGMAIHELATNAIKYGALSNDIGTVTISWRVDGDMLVLNWAEHGGPECSPPPQRGFGSTVVEQMAARSVGGTVAFEFAGTGVKWTMSCPLDKAIEPPDRRHDFLA